jgi:hypothetical protein
MSFVKTIRKAPRLLISTTRKIFLRPSEALLLSKMAWWVTVLEFTTRIYSLPHALQLVAGRTLQTEPVIDDRAQQKLANTIDSLLATDVLWFKPICWKRAAVLHRYLSKQGLHTLIVFGVRHEDDGKFDGHAWLEVGGKPILESSPPEYTVTYKFPSQNRTNL